MEKLVKEYADYLCNDLPASKELTEDMREKLMEKVIVYPENRIEVIWKFREDFNKNIG